MLRKPEKLLSTEARRAFSRGHTLGLLTGIGKSKITARSHPGFDSNAPGQSRPRAKMQKLQGETFGHWWT